MASSFLEKAKAAQAAASLAFKAHPKKVDIVQPKPSEKDVVCYITDEFNLTDWESTFFKSVFTWLDKASYNTLSEKQRAVVEKVKLKNFWNEEHEALAVDYSFEWKNAKESRAADRKAERTVNDTYGYQGGQSRSVSSNDYDDMDDDIPF